MTNTYKLTFADGFILKVIASLDEMLSMLDKLVQQHGDCKSCLEVMRYDRYTGAEYIRIW